MSKNSRSGGKYTGNHTTLIPAAVLICDIANKCALVTKISPGFIKSGLRPPRGGRRVKIADQEGHIMLTVRDNTSQQEVHVYASNTAEVKLIIARGARDAEIGITFRKEPD